MWVKVILIAGIIAVALVLTRATTGARRQALRRLMLAAFVLAAVLSVLFPSALTRVANLLGVGRGADLLLYALVIAFLSFVGTSYRRSSALSHQITLLARQVALLQAAADPRNLHNSSTGKPQDLPLEPDSAPYDK